MNIDSGRLARVQEAASWLRQFEVYHKALRFELSNDCLLRARAALSDPCFDRVAIPGYSRHQTPEIIKVKASNGLGFAIINSEDFDPETHTLYQEPSETQNKRSR